MQKLTLLFSLLALLLSLFLVYRGFKNEETFITIPQTSPTITTTPTLEPTATPSSTLKLRVVTPSKATPTR